MKLVMQNMKHTGLVLRAVDVRAEKVWGLYMHVAVRRTSIHQVWICRPVHLGHAEVHQSGNYVLRCRGCSIPYVKRDRGADDGSGVRSLFGIVLW
jgi:hypothetical protein